MEETVEMTFGIKEPVCKIVSGSDQAINYLLSSSKQYSKGPCPSDLNVAKWPLDNGVHKWGDLGTINIEYLGKADTNSLLII